jgi:hypothetical protein
MVMTGFNHHIWNVLWILIPLMAAVFGLAFWVVSGNAFYHMDPKHSGDKEAGDFSPHLQRYSDLAKLAITLSAGAIAFLINTLVGQKPPVTEFIQKVEASAPIIVGLFGAAIALLILFLVAMTYTYEEYCHDLTHASYKPWKYAMCNSLGWGGLFAFIFAFGWLAVNLFS